MSGEITNIDGGNTAASIIVGFGAGSAVPSVEGRVTYANADLVAVFGEEKIRSQWGEESSVEAKFKRVGASIAEMIENNGYRGGRPGSNGYLAALAVHEPVAPRSGVTERLQELEQLRAKGFVSDEDYAIKHRRNIDAM